MADPYAGMGGDLLSPASHAAVAPNDNVDLPTSSKRLWVGGGGTVALVTVGGDQVTYTVPTGAYLQVRARRVLAGGTTATGIIAEY